MRRFFAACVLLFCAVAAGAQTGAEVSLARTERFVVYANPADVSAEDARLLALQMEARFAAHNQVFRFDPGRLAAPLRVRAFGDRARHESHVSAVARIADPPSAVYMHFARAEMRELVVYLGGEGGHLPFQAFLQFLRAFVPNPPAWIRDGFGVYFTALEIGADGVARRGENFAWLDAVQAMSDPPSPEEIMRAADADAIENFPGLAWSLVSFFLSPGNENYHRSLVEGFMVMSYGASSEENAASVANRIAMWNCMEELARDYLAYVRLRDLFLALIAEGQSAYESGWALEAEEIFRHALEMRPGHFAPWYYLGLLAFNAGDTEAAERYYRTALELGANEATVIYALALNAATAGRISEAIEKLRESARLDPARFDASARILMVQLENLREAR